MKSTALILLLLAPALQGAPCEAPEFRQFDFWVGEWTVTLPNGNTAGTNRITKIAGGCALLEEWTGARGVSGKSLNIYDLSRGVWHQTWVDSSGSLLQIEGKFDGGAMRMSNASNRITWTPLPGGGLRQTWEQTTDGGKTWTVSFDGKYVKK
jgi:hypothetical protein